MTDNINISDIYDKNINFLIGSGASFGLFPTLAVNIKGNDDSDQTIETLATSFDKDGRVSLHTSLFMHYYKTCIEPVMMFDLEEAKGDENKNKVIENYHSFLTTILSILQRRKRDKKCNIFTTNYDGCFAHVADQIIQNGTDDFIVNDGSRGFSKRHLQAKNFSSFMCQTGVFERHYTEIPQINLIHLHGSAYWYQDNNNIRVSYIEKNSDRVIEENVFEGLVDFSSILMDENKNIDELPDIETSEENVNKFWDEYNKLPIVNPTKWKFHETVFEEHYYQMLRLLSYELEKPNSVFITFGFSFADEHILNLVKRSLANPSLQIFVCCFDQAEYENLSAAFELYKNVVCITIDGYLDFEAFNKKIFTLRPQENQDSPLSDELGETA